ncbi:MAG: NAD(P)-dependent oxidoreductase, partial [Alphaproteobacteria bacterium]|nr:NAD(P)-dependent oxidoreductase [Alphaproteobacteria bacterium]
ETAMDAAVKSNVLILSLPGGPEVASLAHNTLLSPKLRGLTIIDMSTTPVKLTREIATKFDKMGIKFLDAPVARTQQAAIDGDLSIMVGGDQELLEKYRDVLLCMGPDISHCGPTGCGQIAKILNNMVVFQNGLALAEALTIGKEAGMDEGLLLDIINKSSGASFVGMNHGVKAMVPGKFPLKQFPARYALKDLSYALQLADEGGVVVPGAELVGKMLKKAIDIGNGDEYWPTIIKTVENNNK